MEAVTIFQNLFIEGEWMTSLDLMDVHILLLYTQLTSIFASLEATDSTSSLPYPSVLLQYCYSFSRVYHGSKRGD